MSLIDKNIIITGGNGFLGSYVVEYLKNLGVKNIYIVQHNIFDLIDLEDIRDMLHWHIEDNTILIHLAAFVGGIGLNQSKPAELFYKNLIMGVQLIDQAYKYGVEKFVTVGTVCSYPKFTPTPFKEEDLWNGYPEETNAPYGIAKKVLLTQAQAYRKQYGFNIIYLIPVNLYGPRDNFNLETSHVIPALIRKFVEARDNRDNFVTLWGDGSPTREFLYVEDAARGICLATEKYNGEEPINLGTGYEISIRNLANFIADIVDYRGDVIWDTSKPNGQPRRALDVTKAERYFGFKAQIDFKEGVTNTIKWYEENKREIER